MSDHICSSRLCDGKKHEEFEGMMLCEYEKKEEIINKEQEK